MKSYLAMQVNTEAPEYVMVPKSDFAEVQQLNDLYDGLQGESEMLLTDEEHELFAQIPSFAFKDM